MTGTPTRLLVTMALCLLSSACALTQPSPPAGDLAVSEFDVAQAIDDQRLPLLQTLDDEALADTDGELVRWGGSIAGIRNRSDGRTLLEIVSRPLHGGGRPIHDDRSSGRFLALLDEFLDPQIVSSGRDVTVLGTLVGRHEGTIGESAYVFPVVHIKDHRIWKPVVVLTPRHFPHWNRYPYSDPFHRDWPFGARRPGPGRR